MATPFTAKVTVPENVLVSRLSGESVLLHLGSETYFGVRETSNRAWELLEEGRSIQQVFDVLVDEYDVAPETLRRDLIELVDTLVERGLVTITDA